MSDPVSPLAAIPQGRMMSVRLIEAELRLGHTFDIAAARAKVSSSAAKQWAKAALIRKMDLAAETPEGRVARYARWAVELGTLGRHEEAAACEADARKLETLLVRLDQRADALPGAADRLQPARDFLGRVAATLEAGAGLAEAWAAVAAYYDALRRAGAVLSADGQAHFPQGASRAGLPDCPSWLPCDPWAVADESGWDSDVGAAMAVL